MSKSIKHKYLNDIGISSDETCIFNTTEIEMEGTKLSKRMKRFKKERAKYGFDSRETWAIDYTLISWLYSHLMWYVEHAPINFEFHKFNIPVLEEIPESERKYPSHSDFALGYQREVVKKEVTQKKAMKKALKYMRYYLKHNAGEHEEEVRSIECAQCAMRIVAELLPALWW